MKRRTNTGRPRKSNTDRLVAEATHEGAIADLIALPEALRRAAGKRG